MSRRSSTILLDALAIENKDLLSGILNKAIIARSSPPRPQKAGRMQTLTMRHDQFLSEFAPFISDLDAYVSTQKLLGIKGWRQHLESYAWLGGYERGVADRLRFQALAANVLYGTSPLGPVAKEIVNDWGKIRVPVPPEKIEPLVQSMKLLKTNPAEIRLTDLCGHRIASASKLYAAVDPDRWVIYDSRVAAALTYLAKVTGHGEALSDQLACAEGVTWKTRKGELRGHLRRVEGFRKLGGTAKDELRALRSFINASWLCQELAHRLEAREPDFGWRTFHVEMVFFMVGFDLRHLDANSAATLI